MSAAKRGINIYFTGTAPEIDTIILKGGYTTATLRKYKLNEAFRSITNLGTHLDVTDPIPEFAYICGWDYVEVTKTTPKIKTFPLSNIDEMRMDILADIKSTQPFIIDSNSAAPYGLALAKYGQFYSKTGTQEGLALKTYLSDKFNNWLDNTWTANIETKSRVAAPVQSGTAHFTISSLLFAQKTWNYLNRVLAAGGTLDDWQEVTYDVQRWSKAEKGIYEGGLSRELVFEEIVSTAASQALETHSMIKSINSPATRLEQSLRLIFSYPFIISR